MSEEYFDYLSCDLGDRRLKQESIEKRVDNINTFSQLDRDGLERNVIERRTLIYITRCGEKIYIQYPGKETLSDDETKIRPWDFRPKAVNSHGVMMPDLSFKDIWDDIVALHDLDESTLSILAAVFYRCALMVDTRWVQQDCETTDYDMESGDVVARGCQTITWNRICLDDAVIEYLNSRIGQIRGFSFEAYLYYNDLLCQNEDCKYYYRDVILRGGSWGNNVGRRNTYFTHMSIIGYLKGQIRFTQLMDMFQRGMGVAPITGRDIPLITDDIIFRG